MTDLTKIRPFLVAKIIAENTDENKLITIVEILDILKKDWGIESYRKTVKQDIDMLIEAGMDIQISRAQQFRYNYIGRSFDATELKILIDAVLAARFISKTNSNDLIEKISALAGPTFSDQLIVNIDVENRIRTVNKKTIFIIDKMNNAIHQGKKVSFEYFDYNIYKERVPRHNGYKYVFSPYRFVWNGDFYYVVGYSDKHDSIVNFRVDRIKNMPTILKEDSVPIPKGFNSTKYINSMFNMYNSKRETVELICNNNVINEIIDKFGKGVDISEVDNEHFKATVEIAINNIFYSWIFGFYGKVKILSPNNVKEEYKQKIADELKNL